MNDFNYDKEPMIRITGYDHLAWTGYQSICSEWKRVIEKKKRHKCVLTIECYPSVREEEIISAIKNELFPAAIFYADDVSFEKETIQQMVEHNLTDDRVFGFMSRHTLDDFFDTKKVAKMRKSIADIESGLVIIVGFGASLIEQGDILVYADLARWEIQQRYRSKEKGNWKADNHDEDILKKYKRGYFFEWRVADRLKRSLYESIDYLLDSNVQNDPKMTTGEAFLTGLRQVAAQPFRLVPFFDPGVWGGQWMKEVCDLDRKQENYAWSFDGVPEENSLYLAYGNIRIEIPAINVVYYQPKQLLGEYVYYLFGTEFPIRFDFLDTMGGQNLSLQVHPLNEYIREQFGMFYTQDESYYMLEAEPEAVVYLGLQEDIDSREMMRDLERAQDGEISFPADKYVHKMSATKHDHFLIPAGTIHCSGAGSMVLEISATPFIFTFKLWDWNRLGLDGKPRPVHIEHGKKVIQWERTAKWVEDNLVNRIETVQEGNGWREEKTGLHEFEFIETRRHWFSRRVHHNTNGRVCMMNLVEGKEAIIESPSDAFKPFIVHYAETFIIPASVGDFTIRPFGKSDGKEIVTLKAYVR